jgi:predicted N-acetyltransferase YhbS
MCMNVRFEQDGDIEKIRNVHRCAFETESEATLVENLPNGAL